MIRLPVLLIITIISATSLPLSAQTASPAGPPAAGSTSQSRLGEPAPLVFWNRQIAVFRCYYENLSPAERAVNAAQRLSELPEVGSARNIVANETSNGQTPGILITVDGQFAFVILLDDLDRESGQTLRAAGDLATAQLRAALDARGQQRSLPVLLRGIGYTVGASILLLLGLWVLWRSRQWSLLRLDRIASRAKKTRLAGFDLRPFLHAINRGLTRLTIWAAAVTLIYVWLAFVLLRFPYSQPWGHGLSGFLINLFAKLSMGIINAVPGMFTVLVIFLLARIVARLVGGVFGEVEKGSVAISWVHRDTARATRRLLVVLVWIFAITVAYPYIPGSGTDAFKGVSVFVGLMVSLGSAGLVNQVMSGLVVIYSRALKPGEFVHIGDDIGTVSEVGMLSTKILTRKKEEVTIPNAVLVGTKTINYSRHASDAGSIVGTTVTIGYDAPWRQVHAMLLRAANQTAGVRKNPAPYVIQRALADFYVEYELVFHLEGQPAERLPILSELHMHIQDAFNEEGVQIMSPHFEGQPSEKVFVPKSQWFVGQEADLLKQERH